MKTKINGHLDYDDSVNLIMFDQVKQMQEQKQKRGKQK